MHIMTEKEVLDKLKLYKEALLSLKNEKIELQARVNQLESQISQLEKEKVEIAEKTLQETISKAEADKEAFIQEISRVIDEASDILKD